MKTPKYAIIALVCLTICLSIWYANEGRGGRPEPPVTPTAAFASPLLSPPATTTSAVVTSVSSPMRFRVMVPHLVDAVKPMPSTKTVRVTIECEPQNAIEFQKAFAAKGVPFYMDVTPIR